jgi:hypothetical protein
MRPVNFFPQCTSKKILYLELFASAGLENGLGNDEVIICNGDKPVAAGNFLAGDCRKKLGLGTTSGLGPTSGFWLKDDLGRSNEGCGVVIW